MNAVRPCVQSSLLGLFIACGTVQAQPNDIKTGLSRKDFSAEASARMMVILTAASGQQALATCIHDRYFGSPLLLRRTLWKVWSEPSTGLERALFGVTKAACSMSQPDVTTSDRLTWLRAGNDSILLDPGESTAEAAADMIAVYESARGDHASAQCALDQEKRSEASRRVSERLRSEPRVPVTLAVYDAYRTLCGLNPNGPASSEIALPVMPDVPTVARERLQIVQDFAICQSGGEANEDACVWQAYKARSKRLFNQLLSSDRRN